MAWEFLTDHTMAWGLLLVVGFIVWKFIIQPIQNEGKPIDPPDEEPQNLGSLY